MSACDAIMSHSGYVKYVASVNLLFLTMYEAASEFHYYNLQTRSKNTCRLNNLLLY